MEKQEVVVAKGGEVVVKGRAELEVAKGGCK